MPDFGVELHGGRLERVHLRDHDVDLECAPGVRGVRRPWKGALEVRQVGVVDGGCDHPRGVLVVMKVGQLLGNPALAGGGHGRRCPRASVGPRSGLQVSARCGRGCGSRGGDSSKQVGGAGGRGGASGSKYAWRGKCDGAKRAKNMCSSGRRMCGNERRREMYSVYSVGKSVASRR